MTKLIRFTFIIFTLNFCLFNSTTIKSDVHGAPKASESSAIR